MFDQTPDMLKRLAEELSRYENFGVCFDYAYATISKRAAKDWAKELYKYVKHIHLNDNDLISDLHLPWGDGKINRQEFYEIYEKYFNGASILLETSSIEGQRKSLECLVKEGFI
jgi:sugar phosphate isomerase/epimerase